MTSWAHMYVYRWLATETPFVLFPVQRVTLYES